MKHFLGLLALIVGLAACGGGGSVSTPATTAPTSYAAKITYVGQLAANTAASATRKVNDLNGRVHTLDSSLSPSPILVVTFPYAGITAQFGGNVEAVVSPEPSTAPSVAFSQTNTAAQLVTLSGTPPPGVVAWDFITAQAQMTQGSGTASAAIGSPVNQTPTASVYSYMSVALDCTDDASGAADGTGILGGTGYQENWGWQWNGSTWIADNNAATADIYIDGPSCKMAGSTNGAETAVTVHIPGGDVRSAISTAFNDLTASSWSNSETSFPVSDAFTTGVIIGKTSGGLVFKLWPNAVAQNGYFGAIEVSGDSVDSFY